MADPRRWRDRFAEVYDHHLLPAYRRTGFDAEEVMDGKSWFMTTVWGCNVELKDKALILSVNSQARGRGEGLRFRWLFLQVRSNSRTSHLRDEAQDTGPTPTGCRRPRRQTRRDNAPYRIRAHLLRCYARHCRAVARSMMSISHTVVIVGAAARKSASWEKALAIAGSLTSRRTNAERARVLLSETLDGLVAQPLVVRSRRLNSAWQRAIPRRRRT
jgi:hypothetical protein